MSRKEASPAGGTMKGIMCAALLFCLLLTACSDTEDYYASEKAFLRFTPVTAAAPLYRALNNPGMFCSVTVSNSMYYFKGADGTSASYPTTALEVYGQVECVAGFVIGTPSVPDLSGSYTPMAFDLVCPSCYEDTYIVRSLSFSDNEELSCARCGRVYDLTNSGIVIEGEEGTKLYRYHLTYSSSADLVLVQN